MCVWTVRPHYELCLGPCTRMAKIKKTNHIKCGQGCEATEHSYAPGGNANGTATSENGGNFSRSEIYTCPVTLLSHSKIFTQETGKSMSTQNPVCEWT